MARKASAAKPGIAPARNSTLDLARMSVREVNQLLHDADGGDFLIENPRGLHAIACGLDGDFNVTIDGHVGYYCAGMNKHATVTVNGNAGTGVAENMMSGRVHVKGDVSQSAGATGCGGLLVDRRQRLGALRHLAARARHRGEGLGRPHVGLHGAGRQPGGARRCRRCAGRFASTRRGSTCAAASKSLGADCVEKHDARRSTRRRCASCSMRRASAARSMSRSSGATARRASSINFHVDNAGVLLMSARRSLACTRRRASRRPSTSTRSPRSIAPRRPASTTSAASGRSASCRISTTCCSSAPRSAAIRSKAIARSAAPT